VYNARERGADTMNISTALATVQDFIREKPGQPRPEVLQAIEVLHAAIVPFNNAQEVLENLRRPGT
jgi:hypothetical protein